MVRVFLLVSEKKLPLFLFLVWMILSGIIREKGTRCKSWTDPLL